MNELLSPRQIEFIANSKKKYNLAHGSMRSGKTVANAMAFLIQATNCPGESLYIFGFSVGAIYRNIILPIFTSKELSMFAPFCTWSKSEGTLFFGSKKIKCLGAGDHGNLGLIQGLTIDLCYCDEMTLFPDPVIDTISFRLSREHSMLFASMNPTHPAHKVKTWIDLAEKGNPNYYALHFCLDDNPYVPQSHKDNLKQTLQGVFLKRNYYGIWCLAEGAVFDFFDEDLHTHKRPPSAEYFVAGIDVGSKNPTACVLVGVNSGRATQSKKRLWAENEYYWDPSQTGRQKTTAELARDIHQFLEPYGVKNVYIDPSAAAFKQDLSRLGIHTVDANNEVLDGIQIMTSAVSEGTFTIDKRCKNLIREIQGYCWDTKKAEKMGEDAPIKINDHAVDAIRYVLATHKVSTYVAPEKREYPQYGQYRMG